MRAAVATLGRMSLIRRTAAATALSLVPASLALAPLALAGAAEVTTTVDFSGCEVHKSPYTTNQKVGGDTSWSPTLRLEHPSPIPTSDEVTVKADLGALPGGTMPESLNELWVEVYHLRLDHGIAWSGPLRLYDEFYIGDWDKDSPLDLPEIEDTDIYSVTGLYDYRPKSIYLLFRGKDANDEGVEYSYECDQVVNSQPILNVAVYDLAGTPELLLDRSEARIGDNVVFDGVNLLAAAPASPRVRASVTIAGQAAGTVEVDDSGAVHGSLTVPAGLSGTVKVRVANGAKLAEADLVLSTLPGGGGGGPVGGVDVNNPATWHVNAQGDIVNGLAQVKVAAKKVRSGGKLKIGGSGFAPGEAVIVKAKGGKGKGARTFTKVVYANAVGAIKAGLKLKKAAKGKWRITAIGVASGRGGLAKFKVR